MEEREQVADMVVQRLVAEERELHETATKERLARLGELRRILAKAMVEHASVPPRALEIVDELRAYVAANSGWNPPGLAARATRIRASDGGIGASSFRPDPGCADRFYEKTRYRGHMWLSGPWLHMCDGEVLPPGRDATLNEDWDRVGSVSLPAADVWHIDWGAER